MKVTQSILVLGCVLAGAASASAQDFTNSSSFLGAINSSYYHEVFSGWTDGSPIGDTSTGGTPEVTYTGPGANNFDWTAIGGTGVANSGQNLWSQVGGISTDQDDISITFNFSNSTFPVSAFGGNFQNTDVSGVNLAGSLVLNFMNGSNVVHTMTLTNQSTSAFYGYVATSPFTSVVITDSTADTWAYAGNLYTGRATPEPASLAALGLASLLILRRRRVR